jgi:sulfofructose kinase
VDVVGIGDLCVDYIVEINKIPQTNQFVPLQDSSWQGGGKVPTAIVAASRLGASAGIISIAGNDQYGKFCRNDFIKNGVDVSHLIMDSGSKTSYCICLAEASTKGRSFIGSLGLQRPMKIGDIDREYICSAKYIHIWRFTPVTIQAAKWARECGTRVVIDADRYETEIENNLDLIDVFICSEYYYEGMFHGKGTYEENCQYIRSKGPGIAIVTLGSRGCVGIGKEGFFSVPVYDVPVRDSTGAGDVFHGAYIYGLLRKWDARRSAQFATAVSSIKCTRLGGRAGIPDAEVTEKFIKEDIIDDTGINKWVEYYRTAFSADNCMQE